jgi:uncharacterized membrane protein (DUF2068 family)
MILAVAIMQGHRAAHHQGGLRAVAVFEASKGLLVLLVTLGVAELLHGSLEEAAEHLLFRLQINPQQRLSRALLKAADGLSNHDLVSLAALALAYAAARFAEAWGLWRGRAWAQWFAILSGLLYLPWEAWALWNKPDAARAVLLLGNLLLVAYMARVRLAERRR